VMNEKEMIYAIAESKYIENSFLNIAHILNIKFDSHLSFCVFVKLYLNLLF
jgi:hypothetical protein